MEVSSLSMKKNKCCDQQKKLARKRNPLLSGTEGSAGAGLWIQLGSVVEAQLSLSVND
jgi:hypothetical protein